MPPKSQHTQAKQGATFVSGIGSVFEFGGLRYSIYSWKHTGAVLLAKNGVPLIKIQRQLRHKSISTTEKYLKSLGISDMGDLQNSFTDI